MEKLITICIPTYNRASLLARNLTWLMPQVEKHKEEVNVYISDNHSEDNTPDIINAFAERYPGMIVSFRHSENIGGNPNFRHAVQHVSSKFVVLMGDDDYILPGFLDQVISIVNENLDVALINWNLLSVDENSYILDIRDHQHIDNFKKTYATGVDFLSEHLISPSLMSSNLFLREPFVEEIKNVSLEDYPGYDWYMALLLSIVHKKCVYVSLPLMINSTSSIGDWLSDAPWYHFFGLGHAFSELGKKYPEIKKNWQRSMDNPQIRNYTFFLLYQLSLNRKKYKKRYKIMSVYSPNKEISKLMYRNIYFPPSLVYALNLLDRIKNKILTLYK